MADKPADEKVEDAPTPAEEKRDLDRQIEKLRKEYGLLSSPESVYAYMQQCQALTDTGRARLSVLLMLCGLRDESVAHVPDETLVNIVEAMLRTAAWAVRIETVNALIGHVEKHGGVDLEATRNTSQRKFDVELVNLQTLTEFIGLPTASQKEMPQ